MTRVDPSKIISDRITAEKKHYLARKELYGHLQKLQDIVLETKGIAMAAAMNNGCDFDELWEWVFLQAK